MMMRLDARAVVSLFDTALAVNVHEAIAAACQRHALLSTGNNVDRARQISVP